ncbi:MAG: ATP-binding protein [Sedimenticolaceae bacterium]
MNLDLAQCHQLFFEESFEGLEAMENGLLSMGAGTTDPEDMHAVFRAAHSIKGGSGTFGIMGVADFIHVMEAILDELRSGQRRMTDEIRTVLLQSVDVLREMLIAARDAELLDEGRVQAQRAALEKVLAGPDAVIDAVNPPGGWSSARRASDHAALPGANSIRVKTQEIDIIINRADELIMTQAMLATLGQEFDPRRLEELKQGLVQLERQSRALRAAIMQIRMLPISSSFAHLPRLVHDLSGKLGKKVEFRLSGENPEVDKAIIDKMHAPLVHLVRNSLDHGFETPDERVAAGKRETGTLQLGVSQRGDGIIIEIRDDGRGLSRDGIVNSAIERGLLNSGAHLVDSEVYKLIFQPGLSTSVNVGDVSGRGVGMDVVRRNINELGGTIEIESTSGKGCAFIVHLPLEKGQSQHLVGASRMAQHGR